MPPASQPLAALDTTIAVDTPERVHFSFRLAGPSVRLAAYAIDLALRLGILFCIALVAAMIDESSFENVTGTGTGILTFSAFILEWGYFVAAEMLSNGQSVGKRALALRVVRSDGLPIGWAQSILRNLLRAADFLPLLYASGLLVCIGDRRFRRLGDLVASTMVISERKAEILPPLTLDSPISPHELTILPAHPQLRADELDAIETLLRRAHQLNPARLDELAEMITPFLRQRLQLPANVHDKISPSRLLALLYHRCRTEHL